MSVLAVDPGSRRLGLALSDEGATIALPYKTLPATSEAAAAIATIARDRSVTHIVIGLPLQPDGREGSAALRARKLGRAIEQCTEAEVIYWDERFSTVAAERALREAAVKRKRRRQVVDQAAATLILQSYLSQSGDDLRLQSGREPGSSGG